MVPVLERLLQRPLRWFDTLPRCRPTPQAEPRVSAPPRPLSLREILQSDGTAVLVEAAKVVGAPPGPQGAPAQSPSSVARAGLDPEAASEALQNEIEGVLEAMASRVTLASVQHQGCLQLSALCSKAYAPQVMAGRLGAVNAIMAAIRANSDYLSVCEHGCQALGDLCSLAPENKDKCAQLEAAPLVVSLLKQHSGRPAPPCGGSVSTPTAAPRPCPATPWTTSSTPWATSPAAPPSRWPPARR